MEYKEFAKLKGKDVVIYDGLCLNIGYLQKIFKFNKDSKNIKFELAPCIGISPLFKKKIGINKKTQFSFSLSGMHLIDPKKKLSKKESASSQIFLLSSKGELEYIHNFIGKVISKK